MERSTSVEYAAEEVPPNPDEVTCDLQIVAVCLKKGLVGDNDVDSEQYLTAYKELYRYLIIFVNVYT